MTGSDTGQERAGRTPTSPWCSATSADALATPVHPILPPCPRVGKGTKPQARDRTIHLRGERIRTPDSGGYRKPRGLLVTDRPSCGCEWQCLRAAPRDSFGAQGAGFVPVWSPSPAAAQAAVAAAPSPALHVEAEPPAVPVVVPALLAVRKASCCRGKRDGDTLRGPGNPPGAPRGVTGCATRASGWNQELQRALW